MSVREMLIAKLDELNADGLVNPFGGCGCGKGDLAPCEHLSLECKAARCVPVPDGEDPNADIWYEAIE